MNKMSLCLLMALATVAIACGPKEKSSMKDLSGATYINVSSAKAKDSVKLQDVCKVSYLALENSKAGRLDGDPRRGAWMCVSSRDIYMQEAQTIWHFTRSGKFVGKLDRKGQDEGQYGRMTSIAVDTLHAEVIVNDSFSKAFKVYSAKDFQFLRVVPLEQEVDEMVLFGPHSVLCSAYPVYRARTGISHFLISTENGAVLKTFSLYGPRESATIGSSGKRTTERSVVRGSGRIMVSDLACPDTVYALSCTDTLFRPAYIKKPAPVEFSDVNRRAYLYLLFETARYAQFVVYEKKWGNQRFVLVDRQGGSITETSLYNKETQVRARRAWWNVPTCQDNLVARIDLCDDMIKHRDAKYQTGRLREFSAKLKPHGNPVITWMQFE